MPSSDSINYRNNWKYRLEQPYTYCFSIPLSDDAIHKNSEPDSSFLKVSTKSIWFNQGYSWDGPSGPTIDTPNAMRASLVHDGLYQALRENRLLPKARKAADLEFRRILKEDGMAWWRRWVWYLAVRGFASGASRPSNR